MLISYRLSQQQIQSIALAISAGASILLALPSDSFRLFHNIYKARSLTVLLSVQISHILLKLANFFIVFLKKFA